MVVGGPNPKHCELTKESARDVFKKNCHTVVENNQASAAMLKRWHGQVARGIPRFKKQTYLQCRCVSIRLICPCPVRIELMFMFACYQHRTIRTETLFENNKWDTPKLNPQSSNWESNMQKFVNCEQFEIVICKFRCHKQIMFKS